MGLFVDTSGSVWHRVPEFVEEARAILESGIVGELWIIACDAQAHLIGKYSRGEEIVIPEMPGGGGTSFKPPFEMIEEEGVRLACAAYLTDLQGDFPSEPEYPVLWVATEPGIAPFGTVINMN